MVITACVLFAFYREFSPLSSQSIKENNRLVCYYYCTVWSSIFPFLLSVFPLSLYSCIHHSLPLYLTSVSLFLYSSLTPSLSHLCLSILVFITHSLSILPLSLYYCIHPLLPLYLTSCHSISPRHLI